MGGPPLGYWVARVTALNYTSNEPSLSVSQDSGDLKRYHEVGFAVPPTAPGCMSNGPWLEAPYQPE